MVVKRRTNLVIGLGIFAAFCLAARPAVAKDRQLPNLSVIDEWDYAEAQDPDNIDYEYYETEPVPDVPDKDKPEIGGGGDTPEPKPKPQPKPEPQPEPEPQPQPQPEPEPEPEVDVSMEIDLPAIPEQGGFLPVISSGPEAQTLPVLAENAPAPVQELVTVPAPSPSMAASPPLQAAVVPPPSPVVGDVAIVNAASSRAVSRGESVIAAILIACVSMLYLR